MTTAFGLPAPIEFGEVDVLAVALAGLRRDADPALGDPAVLVLKRDRELDLVLEIVAEFDGRQSLRARHSEEQQSQ
jgi:hypothetical protein